MSRSSPHRPQLVGDFVPRRPESRGGAPQPKRKLSEMECDALDLAVDELSDDALGRFWGESYHIPPSASHTFTHH